MDYKTEYSWPSLFKDYWALLKGKRFRFVFFTFLRSLTVLTPFLTAYFLGKIIDFFVNYSTGNSLRQFYIYVLIIGFTSVFQIWLRFFAKNHLQTVGAELRAEVKVTAMKKMMNLELAWHEKEETGSKIQKINQGSQKLYDGIVNFSNEGISIIIGLVGGIILFLVLDIKYLVFAGVYLVIYLSGESYFNKRLSYWEFKTP